MADFLNEHDFVQMAMMAKVTLVKGNVAPRYIPEEVGQVGLEKVVITEQGTKSGLPVVDLQLINKNGDKLFLTVSGRIMQSIATMINGVNVRNHGSEYP